MFNLNRNKKGSEDAIEVSTNSSENSSITSSKTQLEVGLSISNLRGQINNFPKEYDGMLTNIQDNLPSVLATTDNFYKSHSQYMNVTVDITDLTPLHSVKHILARIERKKNALAEAQIGRKKDEIKLRKKQKELESATDEFDRELLEVEIVEIMNGLCDGENYIKGALREMSFLVTQYKSILEKLGKDHLTEEDFEIDERRYHVMTAMKQALNAARPRGGIIDEGNSIYLFDIGINVALAQREVMNYLNMEKELLQKKIAPTHQMTIAWLEACADLFKDCGAQYAESRGFVTVDKTSLAVPKHVPLLQESEKVEIDHEQTESQSTQE
jgi:hypothetical protein